MTNLSDLTARNRAFAADGFDPDLLINPSGDMMVIGCVDPRVDPTQVLGIRHGEAAVIRNVGGRITPSTFRTIAMLGKVGQPKPAGPPPGNVEPRDPAPHRLRDDRPRGVPGPARRILRDSGGAARRQGGVRPA